MTDIRMIYRMIGRDNASPALLRVKRAAARVSRRTVAIRPAFTLCWCAGLIVAAIVLGRTDDGLTAAGAIMWFWLFSWIDQRPPRRERKGD